MRTKKLAVILIAVVFAIVVLASSIAMFSVKEINVSYAVGGETETSAVQEKLEEYKGKNLMFVKVEEVAKTLNDFYYLEVVSVEKDFPNAINVTIKERREVYDIVSDGTVYVTTDNGFVVDSYADGTGKTSNREKIRIELDGITITDGGLGKRIATNDDEFLSKVFEMAKSVNLINCIETIKLEKGVVNQDAAFYTYTGVKILITDVLEYGLGVERIQKAFDSYDNVATDFQMTFLTIRAFPLVDVETGEVLEINVLFTKE
jgi:hypothetical protein